MRRTGTRYLLALVAGCAIVGASTAGVAAGTHRHEETLSTGITARVVTTQSSAASPTSASSPPISDTADPSAAVAPSTGGQVTDNTPAPAPAPSKPAVTKPTGPAVTGTPSTATAAPRRTVTTSAAAPAKFRDGQYSATGSYNSPGGIEKLGVTVTLSHDKVTVSALQLLGGAGLSHSFQSAFASAYSSQVVGRQIDAISLGAVSGSSLTSLGFNDALKQIQTQARA